MWTSVMDRLSWGQICALQVTENIFKYLAFQVSLVDRNRAPKMLLREDSIFPIFYNWNMEQMSSWVQTLDTKWLGVNATLQGHRTLPANEHITGEIQYRTQQSPTDNASL